MTSATEGPSDEGLSPSAQAWMRALGGIVQRPLRLAIALPLLSGVLLLVQVWALARALHLVIIEDNSLAAILPLLGLAATMIALRAGLTWGAEIAGQRAAEGIKQWLRSALFKRLLDAGVLWSRGRSSGELADAIGAQVEVLDGYFAHYIPAMASAAVLPLVFCIVLLGFDWIAALALILTVPLIPLFMALVGWGAEAAGRRHALSLSRLSGMFADRVRGLTTLKLFGRAESEAARVAQASEEVRDRTLSVLRIAFLSSAVLEFFAALGVAMLAVYFGLTFLGMLSLRGSPLTLEAALLCLIMAPEVYLPMRQLAAHYHDRANARAAIAQVQTVFDELPPLQDTTSPETVPAQPRILVTPSLTAVDLQVPVPGRTPVSLPAQTALEPGAQVALLGPSGSGKTTLLETLAGLRPHTGKVLLGGRPLADWPEAQLRRTLLLIPQRPWLMPGSLADNLRLAQPGADETALLRALAATGLDELVAELPDGLDTQIGARGHGLSGGQAQRLVLARMFLSDPAILLLDEPTAYLDAQTRDQVVAHIAEFARGRTLLVATHDPAVAAIADIHWRLNAAGTVQT